MRSVLVILAVLAASSAWSFDVPAVADQYNDARAQCRVAESDGEPISVDESNKQCERLAVLAAELKKHGWCWDKNEVEWRPCK